MSKQLYIHNVKDEHVNNDEKFVHEEFLRDGAKGLVFKFYTKSRGKKETSYKIKGVESGKNKFTLTIIKNKDEPKKFENVTVTDLSKHKELKFLIDYLKKDMDKFRKTLKK
jgi:hypothetical protein